MKALTRCSIQPRRRSRHHNIVASAVPARLALVRPRARARATATPTPQSDTRHSVVEPLQLQLIRAALPHRGVSVARGGAKFKQSQTSQTCSKSPVAAGLVAADGLCGGGGAANAFAEGINKLEQVRDDLCLNTPYNAL